MLDVFEHVEGHIGRLRSVRSKARQKKFYIPLDLPVQVVVRRNDLLRRRNEHAHLHCIELGDLMVQKIVRVPRRLSFALLPDLTVRVLGGYSLMVLAE